MDRIKFSLLAHHNMPICNPLSSNKMNLLVDALDIDTTARVIDFGAGKCELLIRIIEKYGVHCDAVEIAKPLLSLSQELGRGRIDLNKLTLHAQDAREFLSASSHTQYDVSICVGSTHAFGNYNDTLAALKKCTKIHGLIVVAEGYWKSKPSIKYIDFLGMKEDDHRSHAGNIEVAEEMGLVPLWSTVATDDDWDQYEWTYSQNIETFVLRNPNDPDCKAMLDRIRPWRKAYQKWGRTTLGFGLYLFRNE